MSAEAAHGHKPHGQKSANRPMPSEAARTMQGSYDRNNKDRFFAKEDVDPLTSAFEAKIAVHPGLGGTPVPADEFQAALETITSSGRTGRSVAYIHVPFCETHCLYCGFYNSAYSVEESRMYTDALIQELEIWKNRPIQADGPIHAVYFGGGTPTALEPEDLKRLLLAVKSSLPLANDCEITIEGRTSNLTKERIEACLEGGANRFSLGVQSFNTEIRQKMGRRSTKEQLIERIGLLQSYNQAAVIIDLIYGFPMQSMDVWLEDIAIAQSLDLDGADCYQLNIYKTSLLAGAIERGKLPAGADIQQQATMFAAGVKAMEDAFYRRLSISHWGRTPRERNIYNQYVKGSAYCLSFGPACGGVIKGYFHFNQPDYKTWQATVRQGVKPIMMLHAPGKHAALFKSISENMEQACLAVPRLEVKHSVNLSGLLRPLMEQWERAGLVCPVPGGFTLTLAGQFWQVNLTQLLLEFLIEGLEES